MKKITLLLFATILLANCKAQKVDYEYLSLKFKESTEQIKMVQYDVRNIITFSDGTAWNNTGIAVIEKDKSDKIFGFSFYGKRDDFHKEHIYYKGDGFEIDNNSNRYKIEYNTGTWFLGKAGGQMIYKDFFKLDTNYKSVEFTETEKTYIINYVFEDDLKNKITQKTKVLELSKETFLPKKVTTSQQSDFGSNQTIVYIFSRLKINENIEKNITEYIRELNEFEPIKDVEPKPNKLLNKQLPSISLKNLLDESETISIKTDQITLIDFWEVWCGHCIAAFPNVENLKNKFSSNLNVIGIISKDTENAIKLVKQKGTTFLNLIGNKELEEIFSVNSWPRYFLVDKNGIIQKEYFGFSEQIEQDIQKLIAK